MRRPFSRKNRSSSNYWITRCSAIRKKAHKVQKIIQILCALCASLRAELRRGGFARFVVMLGGVKTKDVLSLT